MNTCGWTVVAQVCGETVQTANVKGEIEAWQKTREIIMSLMLHGVYPSVSVLDPNGRFAGSLSAEGIVPGDAAV